MFVKVIFGRNILHVISPRLEKMMRRKFLLIISPRLPRDHIGHRLGTPHHLTASPPHPQPHKLSQGAASVRSLCNQQPRELSQGAPAPPAAWQRNIARTFALSHGWKRILARCDPADLCNFAMPRGWRRDTAKCDPAKLRAILCAILRCHTAGSLSWHGTTPQNCAQYCVQFCAATRLEFIPAGYGKCTFGEVWTWSLMMGRSRGLPY